MAVEYTAICGQVCKYFDDAMMALILFTYKRCTMYLASFLQKIYITFLFKCQEDAYKKAVVPFSTKNKKKPGYLYPFLNQGVHKYMYHHEQNRERSLCTLCALPMPLRWDPMQFKVWDNPTFAYI